MAASQAQVNYNHCPTPSMCLKVACYENYCHITASGDLGCCYNNKLCGKNGGLGGLKCLVVAESGFNAKCIVRRLILLCMLCFRMTGILTTAKVRWTLTQ